MAELYENGVRVKEADKVELSKEGIINLVKNFCINLYNRGLGNFGIGLINNGLEKDIYQEINEQIGIKSAEGMNN